MGEGIDQWRKGKLYKANVSERGAAATLASSFASSEGPEEVRVSARHTGDCWAGRSYVPVQEACSLCCPAFVRWMEAALLGETVRSLLG